MNNDNNRQFEKFIRDVNNIRMTEQEYDKMRNNLESFALNFDEKYIKSPYQNIFQTLKKPLVFALAIVLIIGSTKPASASALPGHLLYPVKIIHEEIEAATKTTTEKKIDFEIKRTEKRIQEAIKLAKKEDLDTEKQNEIAKNIKVHTEKVAIKIKDIKNEDPQKALELTSELKTTLKSNSNALKKTIKESKEREVEKERVTKTPILNDEVSVEEKTSITEIKADEVSVEEKTSITEIKADEVSVEEKTSITEIKADEVSVEEKTSIIEAGDIDILISSLDTEIEITKTIEDEVKEEIIKTLDEKDNTESVSTSTEEIEEKESNNPEKTINETSTEDMVDIVENINIQEVPTKTETEEIAGEAEPVTREVIVMETNEMIITTTPKKDPIVTELLALEKIVLLKEKLEKLAQEAGVIISEEQKLLTDTLVQEFVDKGQYGQALIYLQSEIDILSEEKQNQEIEEELGIEIDKEEIHQEKIDS